MNKNLLKTLLCLFAVAAAPDYASYAQDTKGLTRSIIINNGDTIVNGKKFNELDKNERAKLRDEFKEMEKNFRAGSRIHSEENKLILRRDGKGQNEDVVITRDGKEPHILYWNDDIASIGANVRSFKFDGKAPADIRIFKNKGDSIIFNKDFQVFSFGGDSTMRFNIHADSLLKRFNFNIDGLDSNIRKRVITMNRDMIPGRPGRIIGGNGAPMVYERGNFDAFGGRNNSSSFNYSHTDKDGVSSRMSIRISEPNKEQLKKITGVESPTKSLEVNDLTLFPNFSTGKMTLSFNLASKGAAKINVFDSDMKSIFSEDASNISGQYVKQLILPKNGIYYISISQNGSWFVKRLIKE